MKLYNYLTPQKLWGLNRSLWRRHGIKTPIIIPIRFGLYAWCRIFRANKTFALGDKNFPYAVNLQNGIFRTERAVELPISLQTFPLEGDILEVGNVLNQYFKFQHDVVDKYEHGEGVQNVDIVEYTSEKKYDLILCVSTLEHVGWDENPKEPEKITSAVAVMKDLLKPGGKLLITAPLGYNDFLDRSIMENTLAFSNCSYLKRTSGMNDWVETSLDDAIGRKYGKQYPCANAIVVAVFEQTN